MWIYASSDFSHVYSGPHQKLIWQPNSILSKCKSCNCQAINSIMLHQNHFTHCKKYVSVNAFYFCVAITTLCISDDCLCVTATNYFLQCSSAPSCYPYYPILVLDLQNYSLWKISCTAGNWWNAGASYFYSKTECKACAWYYIVTATVTISWIYYSYHLHYSWCLGSWFLWW